MMENIRKYGNVSLIAASSALRLILSKIEKISGIDISVLLLGESGVGKDMIARAIHQVSKRASKPLIIVNCGAIPEGIIESELFGHEKGAFTGAHETRMGYFEKANNGTIFLDEIGDMPKNVQIKLLHVLESKQFFRVGSSVQRQTDVRVIAATNQDLVKLIDEGKFREDLYYRLNTVTLYIPPLRKRKEDIMPLFEHFVRLYAAKHDSIFRSIAMEGKELLLSNRWYGNIRELRNVAEQLVVMERSKHIDANTLSKYLSGRQHVGAKDNLPIKSKLIHEDQEQDDYIKAELIYKALIEIRNNVNEMKNMFPKISQESGELIPMNPRTLLPHNPRPSIEEKETPISSKNAIDINPNYEVFRQEKVSEHIPTLKDAEKLIIIKALRHFGGNRRKVARALDISERTLYRKLDTYELD